MNYFKFILLFVVIFACCGFNFVLAQSVPVSTLAKVADKQYRITVSDVDETIVYNIDNCIGDMNCFTVSYNGGAAFWPSNYGGLIYKDGADNVCYPWSPSPCDKTFISDSISDSNGDGKNDTVAFRVKYNRGTTEYNLTQSFKIEIDNRTVAVTFSGSGNAYPLGVTMDRTEATQEPIETISWGAYTDMPATGKMLKFNNIFMLLYADWERSNASYLGTDAALGARFSATSFFTGGGSAYLPTSTNRYNSVYDVFRFRVSKDAARLMDFRYHMTNPVSPYRSQLSQKVYLDIFDYQPSSFVTTKNLISKMANFGVKDLVVINHVWQNCGYDTCFPEVIPAGEIYGGDVGLKQISEVAKKKGFLFALHENYVDFFKTSKDWNSQDVALDNSRNSITAWPGSWLMKPSQVLKYAQRYSPFIHSGYSTTAAYLDVHSAVHPWEKMDYDGNIANGAMFIDTLNSYRQLFQYEKNTHQGPVSGESQPGSKDYNWAGYIDGTAGALPKGQNTNLYVDFHLKNIHELVAAYGVGFSHTFFYDRPIPTSYGPYSTDDYRKYRAYEIAYGRAGWAHQQDLWGIGVDPSLCNVDQFSGHLLDYFLMHEVQSRYVGVSVDIILYPKTVSGNNMVGFTESYANNKDASQVYVKYKNGLEIYVNANAADWNVAVGGKSYTLPQNGWLAYKQDENFLAYYIKDQAGKKIEQVFSANYNFTDYIDSKYFTYQFSDGRQGFYNYGSSSLSMPVDNGNSAVWDFVHKKMICNSGAGNCSYDISPNDGIFVKKINNYRCDPGSNDLYDGNVLVDDEVESGCDVIFCKDWETVANIGGVLKYEPSVIASNGKLIITGTGGDNALWVNEFDPATNQNEWYSLSGQLASGTSMANVEGGKISVTAVGSDSAVWKRIYQSSKNWSNWESVGAASLSTGPNLAIIGQTAYKLIRKQNGSTEIDKCTMSCIAKTCATLGNYQCGSWSDGCSGTLSCGNCAANQNCSNGTCLVAACVNNNCAAGFACKDGNNCCKSDQCGYYAFPNGQCVDNGGTRSQGPLATNFNLVCRNGVWKTMANAWGCNYFACDSGTCRDNKCVANCANQCAYYGYKQCSGNGYQICLDTNNDNCLEWSAITNCPQDSCNGAILVKSFCQDGTCKQSIKSCQDCSCNCGSYNRTEICSDNLDNDCNGKTDYQDCACSPTITNISVSDASPTENSPITVNCQSNAPIDCLRVGINTTLADQSSLFQTNYFQASNFTLNTGSKGNKTVRCYMDSTCCQSVQPKYLNMTVKTSQCSTYIDNSSCSQNSQCDWCQKCSGNKYNLMGDKCVDKGSCQYFCKEGFCSSECELGKSYAETCSSSIWKLSGTCAGDCKLTQETKNCSGSCGACKENTCSSNTCLCQTISNCCGNSICEVGETCSSCSDCSCPSGQTCSSGQCKAPDRPKNETPPKNNTINQTYCGNNICEANETCSSCQEDCQCQEANGAEIEAKAKKAISDVEELLLRQNIKNKAEAQALLEKARLEYSGKDYEKSMTLSTEAKNLLMKDNYSEFIIIALAILILVLAFFLKWRKRGEQKKIENIENDLSGSKLIENSSQYYG